MADFSRTKKALAESMKDLMQHTPFPKISVGQICENCNLNRKSFYYHFRDKYELVNWIFYSEFVTRAEETEYALSWDLYLDLCSYLQENRVFYVNAFRVYGQDSFREYMTQAVRPLFVKYLSLYFDIEESQSVFAEFFADACLVSIEKWLTALEPVDAEKYVSSIRLPLQRTHDDYLMTKSNTEKNGDFLPE